MLHKVVLPPVENGGVQVQAFIEALVGGSCAESLDFSRLLLHKYGLITHQASPDMDGLSEYDLLLEITRWLLEADLEDTLIQFQRKGINKKEFAELSSFFWGTLAVHIELFLKMPTATSRPMVTEKNGWYVLALEGHPHYQFKDPLSAARIKSLFSTLGQTWLNLYIETSFLNKKIPALYQSLNRRQAALFQWIDQKSVRSLERARQALFRRMWEAQNVQTLESGDHRRNAPDYETFHQALSQAHKSLDEAIKVQVAVAIRDELTNTYARKLDEFLSVQEKLPIIVPNIQVEDDQGNRIPAFLEDVAGIQGICLLAGLPGGGKSRVQTWVARKRISEKLGVDIFLDLREYVKSGIASPYEYAAYRLVSSFGLSAGMDELRSYLIEQERKKMLFWHVENLDRVAEDERKRCLTSLAGLSTVVVSTDDPQAIIGLAGERDLELPKKIFHLLPLSDHKKLLFIEEYSRLKPEADRTRILALVRQLPGMASLPAGIWCICDNNSLSLAEILIGYLSARQTAMGYPPVTLSITRSIQGWFVDWGTPFVNQAYEIVSALLRRGPVEEFDVKRLERMDAILLGSHLINQGEDLGAKTKRAEVMFRDGCRGGLLYKVSSLSYAFVVPEIAHLFAAVAVCASYSAGGA